MNNIRCLLGWCIMLLLVSGCSDSQNGITLGSMNSGGWKFAVVADNHVTATYSNILSEMVDAIMDEGVSLVLFPGDLVEAGRRSSGTAYESQLTTWLAAVEPLHQAGIGVYPVRGNHEADVSDSISGWNAVFSGLYALPNNGPSGESNLSYSVTYHNALFIGLDTYVNLHRVNQTWLDQQLAANSLPHIFVFGHEPAFKAFHTDCLGEYPTERNTFWRSLTEAGARVYFSGHDHFFDLSRIDDGDGDAGDDLYQIIVGTGGSTHEMPNYSYNGDNSPYTPVGMSHEYGQFGYLLVEVSGTGENDLGVTMTWKRRLDDSGNYVATSHSLSYTAEAKR